MAHSADSARLEHLPILVCQDRHQNLVAESLLIRLPVDIKERGVPARDAILKHIPPVSVLAAERHVIWNNIQYLAESGLTERVTESLVSLCAAELFVYARGIDNIVTVHTAGCRLQIRRTVDVRDPKVP